MDNEDLITQHSGRSIPTSIVLLRQDMDVMNETARSFNLRDEMQLVKQSNGSKHLMQNKLTDLAINNKLKLGSIGLVGREKETSMIRSCFESMMKQESEQRKSEMHRNANTKAAASSSHLEHSKIQKELLLLKGHSGVGKTSLARSIEQDVAARGGWFVEGKYDLNASKDQPFAGIAQAYSQVFRRLRRDRLDSFVEIGKELSALLEEGAELLTYVIPELDDVIQPGSAQTEASDTGTDGLQERWKYGFRILTRLLTSKIKPLVFVIDDLQWSDQESLDLIEYLISDVQNTNPLMMIGCYRSNEVLANSPLTATLRSLKEKESQFGFRISNIVVECCSADDVNEMIVKMLDADDPDSARDLAQLCYRRTLGNPYFTIEFMNMLVREKLLSFSLGSLKWGWEIAEIEKATVSTANVVDLVKARISGMPENYQQLLQYAACLGPIFRLSTLSTVWINVGQHDDAHDLDEIMDDLESEMVIEKFDEDRYRWVHDNVQEAALLSGDPNIEMFRFQVGVVLYHHLSAKELEEDLFDVADLINKGIGNSSFEFAALLFRAAKKAKKLSAFHSASRYIANALGMLPPDKWAIHRKLALDLYTLGAQMELVIGNADQAAAFSEIVLQRDDLTLEEKLPLRLLESKRLSSVDGKHKKAVQYCLDLAKDMGYDFLWSRSLVAIQAIVYLSKTIKAVKAQPEGFHKRLGRNEGKYRTIASIMSQLQYSSFFDQQYLLLVLSTCKLVELTLQHGICEFSACNFASLGNLALVLYKNYKDSTMLCELALAMQRDYGRNKVGETFQKAYCLTLAWSKPVVQLGDVLYDAYRMGYRNGELEFSLWCILDHSVVIPYVLGKPIGLVVEECIKVVKQMDEVQQTTQSLYVKCYWQMFLKLSLPEVSHPIGLDGDIICVAEAQKHSAMVAGVIRYTEFQLLLFFDDPSAADRAIKDGDSFYNDVMGKLENSLELFHRGVALYVAARRTNRWKYKRHAKRVRHTLKQWEKAGNPNLSYYLMFLDAEQLVLDRKYGKAEESYKKAIAFVGRSGYIHHAALFNELFAEFLRVQKGDTAEAGFRLEEAIRYYGEWGALGKVALLKAKQNKELDSCKVQ